MNCRSGKMHSILMQKIIRDRFTYFVIQIQVLSFLKQLFLTMAATHQAQYFQKSITKGKGDHIVYSTRVQYSARFWRSYKYHLTLNTSNPCPLQAKMNLVPEGEKMPCTTTKTFRNSWMNSHKSISYHTSTQELCLHVYLPGFDALSACLNFDSQPKIHSIKHHMAQSF